jgi:hypothetical protein
MALAQDATYIVCGPFSGDGSGWDVVFTKGTDGWRYLVPHNRKLAPTGSNSTYANSVFFSAHFAGSTLVTGVDTGVFSSAFAGAFPLVQVSRWAGAEFALAHDNSLAARAVSAPTITPPPLPATPPRHGVYGVAIRRMGIKPKAGTGRNAQLAMAVEPEVIHGPLPYDRALGPSGPEQVFEVSANTNVAFPVFRGRGISYITAPAWYIAGLALVMAMGSA